MRFPTFGELETKVRLDLSMQDLDFVPHDEMAGYANEAIEEAAAEIMNISEDYFLKYAQPISLISSQQEYALPADIFIDKIRGIMYHNGTLIYPLIRLRGLPNKFDEALEIQQFATPLYGYHYFLEWPTAGENAKIILFPAPNENGAFLEISYLREMNRIPLTTEAAITQAIQAATIVDVPYCKNYVMQHMKCRCLEKDLDPRLVAAATERDRLKQVMIDTLTNQIPDDQNTVEMDLSVYKEHS